MKSSSVVSVKRENVVFPTYEPYLPDKNPMFLEKRVYQGSTGKVYPLPFYNRISEERVDRSWKSVVLENDFIRVMVLPEIGGRIHVGQDKSNGYDFFYRQTSIKPALVGLGGPWASGGVEFNWPQHHRPATFMPVDVEVEEHVDGSKTLWLSDHDPLERMKGMHGVCLHPDRAYIELKMRAYNRTPFVQTFLWWANVATHVHEAYQSFFPTDVAYVADHAKRAMSRFPLCDDHYYGVDYGSRGKNGVPAGEVAKHFLPPHSGGRVPNEKMPRYRPNDLSWYANIPVPTSYMCLGSEGDFSGGYDYKKEAGLVQVSNHHISPGKKQWTWGNHEFGYAWDLNLTDHDGPYIELMLGVYTDNQPDFSYLQPGETKTWSVYWYPIQKIGPAQQANTRAALSLVERGSGRIRLGVAVTELMPKAWVRLSQQGRLSNEWQIDLAPDRPFVEELNSSTDVTDCELSLHSSDGVAIIRYHPAPASTSEIPSPASEPPLPAEITSADELYLTGQHLAQYRHATRSPVDYWEEALNRDPGDARCNQALGLWHLRRGEFSRAVERFRAAIARLTSRNPNPYDGEPYYSLGLALRYLNDDKRAYDAFYKATWNQAWQSCAYHALAEIDCTREEWDKALDHLDRSLRLNVDNLRARNLRVIALRKLGRGEEAQRALSETRALDRLDWWSRELAGEPLACDNQTRLDLAIDYSRAGLWSEAIELLDAAGVEATSGTAPLIFYYQAAWSEKRSDFVNAQRFGRSGAEASRDYCFPSRLEEIGILQRAMDRDPSDANAPYYLGNLLYDKRRHREAVPLWEKAVARDPLNSVAWRNLGIAYFNHSKLPEMAIDAYERALAANGNDSRLLYERDQLWKRIGRSAASRLSELERHAPLVAERDDLSIEMCALYNQCGQPERARQILQARKFQPWEGGEGQAMAQFVRTHLILARAALAQKRALQAIAYLEAALQPPENLGEAKHLLVNQSDVYYWLGEANAATGERDGAVRYWKLAAETKGDFQEMSVRAFSEMTYFTACALERLGLGEEGKRLFLELREFADRLKSTPAKIDYFATSLPTMLLFDDDLSARQKTTALFLEGQAALGLGDRLEARARFNDVLKRDPSHGLAADFLDWMGTEQRD